MRWLSDRVVDHLRELPGAWDSAETRYEFREPIGRGGMGEVHRAFDRQLRREVAVKVLNASVPAERLVQEARTIGQLEHPGIIPIHDVGTLSDGRVFYVMKLVRGKRLDHHLARPIPLSDRLRILDRLCDTVAFAHAHGVIHRDLKPENVMIGGFGDVLVLDWGVVSVRGTAGYMAPEQAAGNIDRVDQRADVYALGGILGMLLCGLTDVPPDADVPRALAAIAERARQADPAARYQTVEALAADVKRYVAGLAVDAYREGLLERTRRVVTKYRTAIVLVLAYLAMRVVLLLIAGT
jgi:serine/threonine protein kinase